MRKQTDKKLLTLVALEELDADALYADVAQTYGVLDWDALPPGRLAVLVTQLPPGARIWARAAEHNAAVEAEAARDYAVFDTPEDFLAARDNLIRKLNT